MGYTIIFETKMVRLSDGRILWFDRSGCNNDTAGRQKDEFTLRVLTEKEVVEKASRYMKDSSPWKEGELLELKIGSRPRNYYDYGTHLLNALRRAKPWKEFLETYRLEGTWVESVEVQKPVEQTMTPEEFSEAFYKLLDLGSLRYIRHLQYVFAEPDKEQEFLEAVQQHRMTFLVEKK